MILFSFTFITQDLFNLSNLTYFSLKQYIIEAVKITIIKSLKTRFHRNLTIELPFSVSEHLTYMVTLVYKVKLNHVDAIIAIKH